MDSQNDIDGKRLPATQIRTTVFRIGPLLSIVWVLAGCLQWTNRPSFGPPLPPDISKSELVGRLNANIQKVHSWRASKVGIHTRGQGAVPIRLSAQLAVKRPKFFRLRVSSIQGDEADFGSNDQRFWFWMRRSSPKNVLTAAHEQIDRIQQRFPIPFRPDWVMQVMGVVPIDGRQVELEQSPGDGLVRLVSTETLANGERYHRETVVDPQYGLITEYHLIRVSAPARLVASATLRDHRSDPKTGAVLPQRIDLHWPEADLSMSLRLGQIDVNPPNIPERIWDVPEMRDYPLLDLGEQLTGRGHVRPQNAQVDARRRRGPRPRMASNVRAEGRGQKSEIRDQKSEIRGQRVDIRRRKAEGLSQAESTLAEPPWADEPEFESAAGQDNLAGPARYWK